MVAETRPKSCQRTALAVPQLEFAAGHVHPMNELANRIVGSPNSNRRQRLREPPAAKLAELPGLDRTGNGDKVACVAALMPHARPSLVHR